MRVAKKRVILVENFEEIIEKGSFDEFKAVFDKCDVNAKAGKGIGGHNAFSFSKLPREFAFWLKEQGGDINFKDYYGVPVIFSHVSYRYDGNLPLMIELGADINVKGRDNVTLLHEAASMGNLDNIQLLIDNKLSVHAKHQDSFLKNEKFTPLEMAFNSGNCSPSELLDVFKLLTKNGAKVTGIIKNALIEAGEKFEFYRRSSSDKNSIADGIALDQLYELVGVTPVKKIDKHDGVSPIIINEKTISKQYNKMWEYLVPSNGAAQTGQGEAIRIAGKVAREIMDNGGINWDSEYKKMLDILPQYFELGNKLPDEDMKEIKRVIKVIYNGNGDKEPESLMDYAVKWIMQNQTVIPVIAPTYSR